MWSIVTVVGGKLTVLHMTDGCVVYKTQSRLLKKEKQASDRGKGDALHQGAPKPNALTDKETPT